MLSDITLGQFYPGHSLIHRLDPRTKIILTFLFIIIVFLAENAFSYFFLIAVVGAVIALSQLPWGMVLRSLKPLAFIIVLTLGIHVLTGVGGDILYKWYFITITREGIELGIKMSMRLILLLLVSSVLTFTTSPIVLTDGLEALLRPFKRVGVPAHELAMMMTIALRFIPTLLDETDKIIKAQTARGADFSSGNLLQKAKNMLPVLIPLFISAFRRADELAIAMEARCYRGGEGRTRMHELVYTREDKLDFIFMGVLVLFMIGLRLSVFLPF